ncbi:hypothetical protein [Pseudoxanthomonas sp. JBR18]|uniref:hypothetical protein n=1 Tax=Pseudoxanthomonas sp. JBR18 TaxID=2969308 RepID=UPI002304E307|nr:hypothetical protein [Pseudoxanthomonas sp. JBR18]WCE05729.1 hypothetical protein PJ250_07225 [Pseudoxanthomonas sp. JBR18]
MKAFEKVFLIGHVAVIALFVLCGVGLMWMAGAELLHAFQQDVENTRARFNLVLECIGLLTIALVSMELAQTIFEEEVMRDVKVSGPTRVRRYLSRFMVVVVIALSIETLVMTFELVHEDPSKLPYAGAIGLAAAALLIAWGVFVKLNCAAEALEPEAMEDAKREDDEVE